MVRKRTDVELATLARDLFEGRAIISFQIPQEHVSDVFTPLQFVDDDDMKILGTQCGGFFEYLPDSGQLNKGLPQLSTVQFLHVDDVDNLTNRFEALGALHRRRHRPKKKRMRLKKTKRTT